MREIDSCLGQVSVTVMQDASQIRPISATGARHPGYPWAVHFCLYHRDLRVEASSWLDSEDQPWVIVYLDEALAPRDAGASALFMSSKGCGSGRQKEYLQPTAVASHIVISTGTPRVTIQDSQSAGLLGPRCFLPRGRREGRSKNFDSCFAESAVSIGRCSHCLVRYLVPPSATPFLTDLARPSSLLDRFGPLPPAACGGNVTIATPYHMHKSAT